ncbi:MAG: hypothetical protein WAZ60_23955 [Desulfosalsimonadaceae bacterium]
MSAFDDTMRQILSMVKERQDEQVSPYRRKMKADAQAMYPDIEHTQAMDLQKLKNTGATDVQALQNTGQVDVQGLRNSGGLAVQEAENTGSLARQRLMNTGNLDVANIGLEGHKLGAGATIKASENRLSGDTLRAGAEVTKSENERMGRENAATIGLGKTNSAHDFIVEAVKADPTIATDPAKWKTLLENSRQLTAGRVPATSFIKTDAETASPARPKAAAPPVTSARPAAPPISPFTNPARATLAAPVQTDPIADQLAAQRIEERKRAKKRLTDIIPTFGNNIDQRLSY